MSSNRLSQIYNDNSIKISFEVFPPKTDQGIETLTDNLHQLKFFSPAFISVTYGAGGSTQGRSLKVLKNVSKQLELNVIPHFTCIGSSETSILQFLETIKDLNISNILALRGDPPKDGIDYKLKEQPFKYANELVTFIKKNSTLEISVAGYPESHPEASSLKEDLKYLKRKVDAGAEVIITQLFYDNSHFFRFVDQAKNMGIDKPIIPGILPLTNVTQIAKIATLSGAEIPKTLSSQIERYKDNPDDIKKLGCDFAEKQIQELISFGVQGIHFYTLNKSEIAREVLSNVLN